MPSEVNAELDRLRARVGELEQQLDKAINAACRRAQFITECQQLLGTHDNLQVAIESMIQKTEKVEQRIAALEAENGSGSEVCMSNWTQSEASQ